MLFRRISPMHYCDNTPLLFLAVLDFQEGGSWRLMCVHRIRACLHRAFLLVKHNAALWLVKKKTQ